MEMHQSCPGQRYEKDKKMPLVHPAKLLYTEERREWHTGALWEFGAVCRKVSVFKGVDLL